MEIESGAILWRGPSELTGEPIILVATGFNGARNSKTGAGLVQTYIIRDDISVAKGIYPVIPEAELPGLFEGLMVRIGAYGDGAAVPARIWHLILSRAIGRTGYTHQWRDPRFQYLQAYTMASVDSEAEAREAWAMGWRTFRVAPAVGWAKLEGEGLCPASFEAGKRVQCDGCKLCSGTAGHGKASIMIPDHSISGTAAKRRAGIMPPLKRNPNTKVRRAA